MKRIFAILLCIGLAWVWTGCTAPTEPADSTTAPSKPDQPIHPAISLVPVTQNTCTDDGTLIFFRSYQTVRLTLANQTVAQAIQADLQSRINGALSAADQLEAIARAEYTGQAVWNPYFLDIQYATTRLDCSILSLSCKYSTYTGGNHPNLSTQSVTYDLTTGKELSLSNILRSGASGANLATLVNQALSQSEAELWDDYEETVTSLFSAKADNIRNWYFSESGLCFYFSPYEIAPYAAGTIIAEIPYGNLTNLIQPQFLGV